MAPIRVLVVDDSAFFRKTLSAEIMKRPGFLVVGTAIDGRDAVEKVRTLDPDVVTLDVEMPVMSGIEALSAIASETTCTVIMVSAQTAAGAKITIEALERGAVDFIPKTRGPMLIHEKIEAAAQVRRLRQLGLKTQRSSTMRPRRLTRSTTAVRHDAKLVVIGSSTGGPQALVTLLGALPGAFPIPIVIAQHMPPHFTEALAKRLDLNCALRVVHASNGEKIVPGTVYIAPGGGMLRVNQGEISVSFVGESHLYKPSVDVLTESAIASYGRHIIGILLTGMGADGANSMLTLHKIGGYTIAQDQATSVVYGMPKALADIAGADESLPIGEIGRRLVEIAGCRVGAIPRRVPLEP